jgi:D-hydroxyproline dehydrogenase subunit gamma
MFTQRHDPSSVVTFTFEGREIAAAPGSSVAAALLLASVGLTRTTPVSGAPRAPYCMMGVCFDCLVVIDGEADRQACMIQVRDGMVVECQRGRREVD